MFNSDYKTEEKDVNITQNQGQITSFKYAPTTSCGKLLANINLRFIRRSFTFENLNNMI